MIADASAEEALDRAEVSIRRVEQWRSHLLKLGTGSIHEITEDSFLGREMRAAAAVMTMAELEALLRDMLYGVGLHINKKNIPIKNLIPSLRALAAHPKFESVSSVSSKRRHSEIWGRKMELTRMEESIEIAQFPGLASQSPQPPLDGGTIQARHISLVWEVLGFPGNPLDGHKGSHKAEEVLRVLSKIRNDAAHRNVDIAQLFSEPERSSKRIAQYLETVASLMMSIGIAWYSYLSEGLYLLERPGHSNGSHR